MKKLVATILAMILLLSAASALADTMKVGELTYLNSDNVSRTELLNKVLEFVTQSGGAEMFGSAEALEMVEFDNLNAMQMALDAGQIDAMILYSTVGNYLAAVTGNYNVGLPKMLPEMDGTFDLTSPVEVAVLFATDAMMGTDFSFMMQEKDAALKDEFDQAIAAMQEEGVLAALNAGLKEGDEPEAVEMPVIEGAETIKVAVTGDLPPMDFTDASGKPAGYNTAILAEISKRINKNIELVSIDSASRAIALTSGSVDVVFWARVGAANPEALGINTDILPEKESWKTALDAISANSASVRDTTGDIPEGMILTAPYLHDIYLLVYPKA